MKTISFLLLLILTSGSCSKITENEMIVIKGCEGTYLRLNDLDYSICNEEKLDEYDNGTTVKASIMKEENCKNDRIHCMMVHDHETAEGIYTIKSVK